MKMAFTSGLAAAFAAAALGQTAAPREPPIAVGPNVRVSAVHPERLHHEVVMAASPKDPKRVLAAAMIFDAKDASRHVIVYVSSDGGKTWQESLEVDRTSFVGDPTIAFDADGAAYLVALALSWLETPDHHMLVYRSGDGGRTWGEPAVLPFIDREWIVFDQTSGPRRGRLYLHGNAVRDQTVDGDERIVFTFYRSDDRGKTFSEPKKLIPDGDHMAFGTGTSVVLSDGTFVASFPEWEDRKNLDNQDFKKSEGAIKVVASTNGGDSFEKAVKVADWHGCKGWTPGLPVLAADASGGPFRDRLYLTWPDQRSGRCEILFSFSSDKGRTWSPPAIVNDDQSPAERRLGRHHMLPAVAVNSEGVVGVSWSDRRDAAQDNRQWTARFAASLDGGVTFTPSVPLSPDGAGAPTSGYMPIMAHSIGGGQRRPRGRGGNIQMEIGPQWIDFLTPADTSGIAAGADGTFHTVWVDHRTGIPQMWSSAVRVDGKGQLHGSADLAALTDLTQSIAVDFANTGYDPKTRIVSLDVSLINTSKTPIAAPLKLRVVALKSSAAVPEILDADAGPPRAGAVWDFSAQLPNGGLAPGQTSKPRRLRFRLDELGEFRLDPRGGMGSLLSVETQAFGKEAK